MSKTNAVIVVTMDLEGLKRTVKRAEEELKDIRGCSQYLSALVSTVDFGLRFREQLFDETVKTLLVKTPKPEWTESGCGTLLEVDEK